MVQHISTHLSVSFRWIYTQWYLYLQSSATYSTLTAFLKHRASFNGSGFLMPKPLNDCRSSVMTHLVITASRHFWYFAEHQMRAQTEHGWRTETHLMRYGDGSQSLAGSALSLCSEPYYRGLEELGVIYGEKAADSQIWKLGLRIMWYIFNNINR